MQPTISTPLTGNKPASRASRSTGAVAPGPAPHLREIEEHLSFIEAATGVHQAHLRADCVREIRARLAALKNLMAEHDISVASEEPGPTQRLLDLVRESRSALGSSLYLACVWLPRMAYGNQAYVSDGTLDAALAACTRLHARMITLGRRWPDSLCEEGAQSILRALRQAHALMEMHPDEMARSATDEMGQLVRQLSLAAELDRQKSLRLTPLRKSALPATPAAAAQPLCDAANVDHSAPQRERPVCA